MPTAWLQVARDAVLGSYGQFSDAQMLSWVSFEEDLSQTRRHCIGSSYAYIIHTGYTHRSSSTERIVDLLAATAAAALQTLLRNQSLASGAESLLPTAVHTSILMLLLPRRLIGTHFCLWGCLLLKRLSHLLLDSIESCLTCSRIRAIRLLLLLLGLLLVVSRSVRLVVLVLPWLLRRWTR